jgi:hypothetical protein
MALFRLEVVESNISFTNQQNDDFLYIINGSLDRIYTSLYGSLSLDIALPTTLSNMKVRNNILSMAKKHTNVKFYAKTKTNFRTKEILLMDGLIMQKKILPDRLTLIIYDKSCLLSICNMKPKYSISSNNFENHATQILLYKVYLDKILRDHEIEKTTDFIIYPDKKEIKRKGGEVAGYGQTIYNYLQPALNDLNCCLTTVYYNNKSYLAHVDTFENVSFLSRSANVEHVIDYDIDLDFTQIYSNITVGSSANLLTNEMGKYNEFDEDISTTQPKIDKSIQYAKTENTLPPMLFTTKIKSTVNDIDIKEYAQYLYLQQIRQAININITVPSIFTNLNTQDTIWNLFTKINFATEKEDKFFFLNDIRQDFEPYIKKNRQFIIGGFKMLFSHDNIETTLNIIPMEFLKYPKI